MEKAKEIYKILCDVLNDRLQNYEQEDVKLNVRFEIYVDDLPMKVSIYIDSDKQLIRLIAPLAYNMREEKRVDGIIATIVASEGMRGGSFDYNFSNGEIWFRMTQSYMDSTVGKGLFQYMVDYTSEILNKYNAAFGALNEGSMDIEEFVKKY